MELVLHNSDLVREILLRVPAKSLVKFESVCREWLSLISSHEFGQQHTIRRHKVRQQSLILQPPRLPRQWFHLNLSSRRMTSFSPSLPDDAQYIILQSSNGLLLLRRYFCFMDNYYLYVHNPATKQSRKIMIPPRSTTHPHVVDVALAFDPSRSPYYELVCIRRRPEGVSYRIEVYSSKSHTWNNKELTLELPTYMGMSLYSFLRNRVRVYWNNAVYWSSELTDPCHYYYCCFDISKGEMKTLPFPDFDHRNGHGNVYRRMLSLRKENEHAYFRLQESNGRLFHVELMRESVVGGFCEMVEVWELDDDDHRWLLRHHCALPSPPEWQAGWAIERPSILTFLVDTCSLLICRGRWMKVYNLNFGRYEKFLNQTGQPFYQEDFCLEYYDVTALQFGPTLALV